MSESRVRKLSRVIMENPKYLSLDGERVEILTDFLDGNFSIPDWDYEYIYPQTDDFEEMTKFFLVFNSINYCYFTRSGDRFEDGTLGGATLAAARLTERWEEIKDPLFLSNIDSNYLLSELFFAQSPLPMIKQRVACLREVGKFLNEHSDVSDLMHKLFSKYHGDAYVVSQALPTFLPMWADPFYKRAQLFVGMVYGRFKDYSNIPIKKESLKNLTVFADYRVPQALISMGIINPGASLRSCLHNNQEIGSGSRKELEIRAATILGADLLQGALNKTHNLNLNSLHVDAFLWSLGRKDTPVPEGVIIDNPNHHRTFTTDY